MLIENKYAAAAAIGAFLFLLWFTDGSLVAAFGGFALIAGLGWAVRRLFRSRVGTRKM